MPKQKRRVLKRLVYLGYAQRYELAYLYHFRGLTTKVLAHLFKVHPSTITKIKREFIATQEVWLDKPVPEQMKLFVQKGTRSTSEKK